ncbi:hypothetical protein [Rouxiella sp. Mn2063]|uniref:hypothetical protein n=1 Tax=Rouxiella sp. Mn2063 TaxID=3395262 RepID=UPI003BC72E0B
MFQERQRQAQIPLLRSAFSRDSDSLNKPSRFLTTPSAPFRARLVGFFEVKNENCFASPLNLILKAAKRTQNFTGKW